MLFKDVIATPQLKQQLIGLVKDNRVSHAQLFLSQPGNDSFALAVAYAQYLCCQNRGEEDSCGVCPSCVKFSKLAHPDLHLIFPNCITKEIKKDPDSTQFTSQFSKFVMDSHYHIDLNDWVEILGGENKQASINIRDCANIINQNSVRSYEGGYKVYILWMVERLYHAAAPKLLKTLEEPESKTLFILIAENQDKILNTILSRTQLIKIPPLSDSLIKEQLIKDLQLSEEQASEIAKISEGSYNRAIKLYKDNSEIKALLHYFELTFSSMAALSKSASNQQINFLELEESFDTIITKGREYQKSFFSYFIKMIRNILLTNNHNESCVPATNDEKRLIEQFRTFITLRNISPILEECNKAIYHIERNGKANIIFTDFYLKVSKLLIPRP